MEVVLNEELNKLCSVLLRHRNFTATCFQFYLLAHTVDLLVNSEVALNYVL